MKKIAISGVSNKDRLIMCNALSHLTGLDVVRCTPHTGFSIKYGLNKNLKEYEWHELYSFILQSFIERIEIESLYDEFISNGSVFNELAYLETMKVNPFYKKKGIRNKKYSFMNDSLKSVISEYAQKYDCIIHIASSFRNTSEYDFYIDESLKKIIIDSGIKYFLYEENTLFEMLEKISKVVNITTIISPATAIRKAELELSKFIK